MTTRWKEKEKRKLSLDQNVSEPRRLGPIDVNWLQSMEHANRHLCLLFGAIGFQQQRRWKAQRARDPCRKENPRDLHLQSCESKRKLHQASITQPKPDQRSIASTSLVWDSIWHKSDSKTKMSARFDVQILLWPKVALPIATTSSLSELHFFPSLSYSSCVNSDNGVWVGVKVASRRGVKGLRLIFCKVFSANFTQNSTMTSSTHRPHS